MNTYTIRYRMFNGAPIGEIQISAGNIEDALYKATYDVLGTGENYPYRVWVVSRMYKDGRIHYFNTTEERGC